MKNSILILLLCILSCFANAQKIIEKRINNVAGKTIDMNIQIADSIRVITWNKSEVYAKASIEINKNKYNDIYLVSFDESGNTIDIRAKFDDKKREETYDDSCNCYCNNFRSKIYWDVYIPENATFNIETINGNIVIEGKTDQLKAHSISGFIDLSVPESRKADLKMSTISGTIYTNLAIGISKERRGGNEVASALNGGGKRVDVETISGDIFLRRTE